MQINTHPTKRGLADMLAEFWLPHLEACEDLFAHLEYVDKSGKEIRAKALRQELLRYDDVLAAQVGLEHPNWRFKEYRSRTIITLAGKISYLRRIYTEPCGIAHAYLDEVLGIRTRRMLAPDAFLWIVKMAADISFRKTAHAFYERTGAKISHWLVMSVIREEGALILEELYNQMIYNAQVKPNRHLRWSTDALFVEYDGIYIPLQKSTHDTLLPRWRYEQLRHKQSFELKVACAYMGKDKRRQRLGCIHFASNEQPAYFWPLLAARVSQDYVPEDISTVYASHDAAGWCKNNRLDMLAPVAEVMCHLDAYHVNKEVLSAFKSKRATSYIIKLIYKKRMKRLFSVLKRVITTAKKDDDTKRYLALRCYLENNISLIKCGLHPSMGTMEGTNAHVYAARMKVWGGAWSRAGGQAMALVRARIASGQPLIKPKLDNIMLTDIQQRRRREWEELQFVKPWYITDRCGHGYIPPQGSIALSIRLPPNLYGWLMCPRS